MNGINKGVSSAGGNELVIGVCKIILPNGGVSIQAPALDTIRVIHSLATNVATSPVIPAINSIVGSVAYTDPGVI
jgi:hypothetical protein